MRHLLLMLTGMVLFSTDLLAQTSAASALSIPSVTIWNNNAPTYSNFCLSGVAAQTANTCAGAMTDVAWLKFTIPSTISGQPVYTASAKITVVPTGFDAIVEFFTGTSASPVFRQCVNSGGSGVTEILRTDPNAPTSNPISPGVEYYVRVSSTADVASGCFQAGVQYYAGVYVRDGQFPNPAADTGLPGYRINQGPQRNVLPPQNTPDLQAIVQASRWRFVDISLPPGSPGCTVDINNNFSGVTLSSASCICYGNSYNVFVQARYEGHWAGETLVRQINLEASPNTTVSIPTVQCAVVTMNGTVQASPLAPSAQYAWEWCNQGVCNTYQSGVAGLSVVSPSQIPCIRFGRTYSVRTRVSYCGVWGDWSSAFCIRTPPIGYTQVSNCPSAPVATNFVATCTQLSGVNSYSWAVAPVNPATPTVPIGPAIVVTTTGAGAWALGFSSLGVVPGVTYRVQVKPRVTTCGTIQEGDYGTWCLVTIAGGSGMALESDPGNVALGHIEKIEYVNYDFVANRELEFFRLAGQTPEALTFSLPAAPEGEQATLRLTNLSGQVLEEQPAQWEADGTLVRLSLADKPASGIYIVHYLGNGRTFAEKVFIP